MQDVSRCLGREAAEQHQRRRRNAELLENRIHDRWTRVEVRRIPSRRGQKTTSVTDNENLGGPDECGGQDEDGDLRPILRGSCENEGDWQGRPFHEHSWSAFSRPAEPYLLNKDGKLIDSFQIIIAQKQLERKNDIYGDDGVVTSKDRYITIMSTVAETAVVYLGFEYRSVHDGERRGFTVKPAAKYVDECLDIVQLQNAKAEMTPFDGTEEFESAR